MALTLLAGAVTPHSKGREADRNWGTGNGEGVQL